MLGKVRHKVKKCVDGHRVVPVVDNTVFRLDKHGVVIDQYICIRWKEPKKGTLFVKDHDTWRNRRSKLRVYLQFVTTCRMKINPA